MTARHWRRIIVLGEIRWTTSSGRPEWEKPAGQRRRPQVELRSIVTARQTWLSPRVAERAASSNRCCNPQENLKLRAATPCAKFLEPMRKPLLAFEDSLYPAIETGASMSDDSFGTYIQRERDRFNSEREAVIMQQLIERLALNGNKSGEIVGFE